MQVSKRRRKTLIALLAIAASIVLVAGTWVAAMQFQSSAQREAAAQPPEAQPILVPITKTDLVERTTMMAAAERSDAKQYVLPKPGATSVITRAGIPAGSSLASGQVVTWINDRPLFALKGVFPLYRDLGPGDSGEDVRMIQRALAELGYSIASDGVFGTWTATCIKDLFSNAGAEAATRDKREEPTTSQPEPSAASSGNSSNEKEAAQASQSGNSAEAALRTPASERPATPKKPEKEVYLRSSEVLIIPELPAHVTATPPVGTVLGDQNGTLTLAGTQVTLRSEVPGNIAVRLQAGRKATASAADQSLDVAVTSVDAKKDEATPGSPDQQRLESSGSVVTLTPTNGKIPPEWAGKNDILISINLSEPMENVLTVPQRAIAVDASGQASILVSRGQEFVQVAVKEIGCLSGMCAIDSMPGAEKITEGQHVRVDR